MEVIDDLDEAVDFAIPSASSGNQIFEGWIESFGFLIASIPAGLLKDEDHLLIESAVLDVSGVFLVIRKAIEDLAVGKGLKKRGDEVIGIEVRKILKSVGVDFTTATKKAAYWVSDDGEDIGDRISNL